MGIRIVATQILAKSKISQNRAPVDFDGVREKMLQLGKMDLYKAMGKVIDSKRTIDN